MQGSTRQWTCAAGCKAQFTTTDPNVSAPPWAYLEITRSYRCPACERELRAASALVGLNSRVEHVALGPHSAGRGALPKATAHTIAAPSVKP